VDGLGFKAGIEKEGDISFIRKKLSILERLKRETN